METKNILCVIPARYASTRLPGKPLATIRGQPLIRWVYKRVSLTGYRTVVATDNRDIFDAVADFGGTAVLTAEDHASGSDRCEEAALTYALSNGFDADVVVNVQGDEPLIHPGDIKLLAENFDLKKHEITTLAKKIHVPPDAGATPNKTFVVTDRRGKALYFSRLPVPYYQSRQTTDKLRHFGMYAYRRDCLKKYVSMPQSALEKAESLEQNRWLENGGSIHVFLTERDHVAIDTKEDLDAFEKYLDANGVVF